MTNRLGQADPTFAALLDPGKPPKKDIPDRGQLRMGVWVFLVSLGVLFASSLAGYIIILQTNPLAVGADPIEVPGSLAVSTVILLFAGVAFHKCQQRARRLDFERAEKWLVVTAVFTVGFLVVQIPGILKLLIQHEMALAEDGFALYGLTLSLVALHALHVIGGLVPLGLLVLRATRAGINSKHASTLRLLAIYWHFLEIVWVTMYVTFLVFR